MKFFEFVTCCGPVLTSRPSVPAEPAQPPEETRSLVQKSRRRRWRKRGRLGPFGSPTASAEWKPSLCSISEDNVVLEKREEDRTTAGVDRVVKRKSSSGSSSRSSSTYSDNYGRAPFPTVIPAFSPTPFMF